MNFGSVRDRVMRLLFDLEDRAFDLVNRIDTSGVLTKRDLRTSSKWKEHATAYHAVWTRNIRTLINQSAAAGQHPSTFIDIGCGKGKACFYAARSGQFNNVVGIDFDSSLVQTANSNLKAFGRANIAFLHADAANFTLGDHQCLVFMFNPFDKFVLSQFLANNTDSFRRHRHVLAYANDRNRDTLIDLGYSELFRDARRKISLWQLS